MTYTKPEHTQSMGFSTFYSVSVIQHLHLVCHCMTADVLLEPIEPTIVVGQSAVPCCSLQI